MKKNKLELLKWESESKTKTWLKFLILLLVFFSTTTLFSKGFLISANMERNSGFTSELLDLSVLLILEQTSSTQPEFYIELLEQTLIFSS